MAQNPNPNNFIPPAQPGNTGQNPPANNAGSAQGGGFNFNPAGSNPAQYGQSFNQSNPQNINSTQPVIDPFNQQNGLNQQAPLPNQNDPFNQPLNQSNLGPTNPIQPEINNSNQTSNFDTSYNPQQATSFAQTPTDVNTDPYGPANNFSQNFDQNTQDQFNPNPNNSIPESYAYGEFGADNFQPLDVDLNASSPVSNNLDPSFSTQDNNLLNQNPDFNQQNPGANYYDQTNINGVDDIPNNPNFDPNNQPSTPAYNDPNYIPDPNDPHPYGIEDANYDGDDDDTFEEKRLGSKWVIIWLLLVSYSWL